MKHQIVLIAHNLRSSYNVGSLLRTADGLGIKTVYLTGYTPYPLIMGDGRLPHLAHKIHKQISKTSLGAETNLQIYHNDDIFEVIKTLKSEGYTVDALELDKRAVNLSAFKPPQKLALIVGREVEGIEPELLNLVDKIIQIPMKGKKESLNVVVAAAIALHHLTINI